MSDYGLAVSNVAGTFVIISECTLKDITGKVESQGMYECFNVFTTYLKGLNRVNFSKVGVVYIRKTL